MNTLETDRIVDDYLRRLEAAAAHLQRSRRAELVAEIREHIDVALRQEEAANEVAVRNVLDRLGPPEEIVDAAEPMPARRRSAPARSSSARCSRSSCRSSAGSSGWCSSSSPKRGRAATS